MINTAKNYVFLLPNKSEKVSCEKNQMKIVGTFEL